MPNKRLTLTSFAALAALALAAPAQAGGIYAGIGLPGVMVGYAHPLSPSVALRADVATLGTHNANESESGIDYRATLKTSRTGLFADWFFSGGWRLTGGATFNDMKLELEGRGNGGTITIGDNSYVAGPDDRFNVLIKFPRSTPYVGLGYGHQAASPGWGFVFDAGASIGRAKVEGSVSGPTLSGNVSQADIDKELADVREGVGKVRFLPQLSIGLTYRF